MTTTQPSLFPPPVPFVRRSATSAASAASHTEGANQEQHVRKILRGHSLSDAEIYERGLSLGLFTRETKDSSIRRARIALEKRGEVCSGGHDHRGYGGRLVELWRLTDRV